MPTGSRSTSSYRRWTREVKTRGAAGSTQLSIPRMTLSRGRAHRQYPTVYIGPRRALSWCCSPTDSPCALQLCPARFLLLTHCARLPGVGGQLVSKVLERQDLDAMSSYFHANRQPYSQKSL